MLKLSFLLCNAELSETLQIKPSKASTSLAKCDFPIPPTAGLQLSCPMLDFDSVTSSVFAPKRADACAASQPACPPPITTTSKFFIYFPIQKLENISSKSSSSMSPPSIFWRFKCDRLSSSAIKSNC